VICFEQIAREASANIALPAMESASRTVIARSAVPPVLVPTSPTGLFWNTRGNIRCELHARELDLETWEAELWTPIPEHEEPSKRHYQCQRCSPDSNAIAIR
jgi:hypothetical protein